jgi:hypothetical protein
MSTPINQPYSGQRDRDDRSNKGDLPGKMIDPDDLDSKVNTDFDENKHSPKSLTNQESPKTDPNTVPDKPGFKRSNV